MDPTINKTIKTIARLPNFHNGYNINGEMK